ncbi:anaerobic ribonucleoside-triphosphate reductase activating protein [Microgenomates group bacterium]|nr:anaerobic ribonucleoside-triphosphate reductase activating protein [Microgenomates group bacterium]
MKIRLAAPIQSDSIVDGEGLRAVIWTQGCRHRCPGCHNPETWDEAGGKLVDVEEVKRELRSLRGQEGLTFSGGEPFLQAAACLEIAQWARKEMGWNIWSFSGYTYEELLKDDEEKRAFLKELEVLIDGPFVLAKRDINLRFRGSSNQRLLRLKNGVITAIM